MYWYILLFSALLHLQEDFAWDLLDVLCVKYGECNLH